MNHEKHKKHEKYSLIQMDTDMKNQTTEMSFDGLVGLFEQTQTAMQRQAARSVDIALVVRNWLFGWYIVEFEDGGAERSELYGKKLIKRLSDKLTANLGKGFSKRSLEQFRSFYTSYQKIAKTVSAQSPVTKKNIHPKASDQAKIPGTLSGILPKAELNIQKIWQTLSAQFSLSWSHYVVLLTIKLKDERRFYEIEAIENTNIHTSEYQLYLPEREALKKQLEAAQREWEISHSELSKESTKGEKL